MNVCDAGQRRATPGNAGPACTISTHVSPRARAPVAAPAAAPDRAAAQAFPPPGRPPHLARRPLSPMTAQGATPGQAGNEGDARPPGPPVPTAQGATPGQAGNEGDARPPGPPAPTAQGATPGQAGNEGDTRPPGPPVPAPPTREAAVRPAAVGGEARRIAVLVAGMHASGAGAVARVLHILGCDAPRTVTESGAHERGCWTSKDVIDLNDRMFTSAGSTWDDWQPFDAGWHGSAEAKGFRTLAGELLENEFGNSRFFVLADPRTCRLLEFWAAAITDFGAHPVVVSPIRNPLDVTASLAARDGVDPSTGPLAPLLWLRHVLDAERASRPLNRGFLRYEELVDNPHAVVARLGEELGIAWSRRPAYADVEMEIDELVSPALRHQAHADASLLEDPGVSRWTRSSFDILDRWAAGDVRKTDRAALDAIRRAFDQAAPAFSRALAAARETGRQLVRTEAAVAERDARLRERDEQVRERDAQIRERDEQIRERETRIRERDEQVRERDGQVQERDAQVRERDAQVEALHLEVGDRDRRIESLSAELEWTATWIRSLLGSRTWRAAAGLRAIKWTLQHCPHLARRLAYRLTWRAFRRLPFRARGRVYRGRLGLAAQRFKKWLERGPATEPTGPDALLAEWLARGPGSGSPDARNGPATEAAAPHDVSRDGDYVALDPRPPAAPPPVQVIAFYLPQFHPIPENDEWWGPGFTEWTNVTAGKPLFEGHHQPQLPADLGFYDLRVRDVQRRQVELARAYGIAGFCFYYYWFAGRRLLEAPLDGFAGDDDIDLPFCVCWANENWTRAWNGLDQDVLIGQAHSPEDDLRCIEDLGRYLRHRRYVRIDGKPLVIVYRPSLLPDAAGTAARWRGWCRDHGIGEIHLAYTQSFDVVDPGRIGFDSAIEFPPNLTDTPDVAAGVDGLDPDFRGSIYDWSVFPARSERYAAPPYPLFRTVNCGWDNTARRGATATVWVNSTPAGYRRWLENAIADTQRRMADPDRRLVFVNAWNEWAEGAHLEPDRKYGFAWLEATRQALATRASAQEAPLVVYVLHDAHPHGAQFNALAQVEGLSKTAGVQVHVAALGDGVLLERFERLAPVHRLWEAADPAAAAAALAGRLGAQGASAAILNTTVSGALAPVFKAAGLRTVVLVHELPGVIESMQLQQAAAHAAGHADVMVFAHDAVRRGFARFAQPQGEVRIRPQGLYKTNRRRSAADREAARRELRAELGLDADAAVVLGVGFGDRRKGIDLFVDVALDVTNALSGAHFAWLGHLEVGMEPGIRRRIAGGGEAGARVHLAGRRDDTDLFYAGADILALTSREDPFPSVVLEAMDAGLPVVGFEDAGGCEELLREGAGVLAPFEDTGAFAGEVRALLRDREAAARLGARGRQLVAERFGWTRFVLDLAHLAGLPVPRVSVIVPNFNYRQYLAERLESIAAQTHPIYELIVLDDASTDGSREWLEQEARSRFPEARLVFNDRNSGGAFHQWRRGVELATGDVVWIAEADDLAAPDFLRTTVRAFDDPETVLSYCQSQQMREDGSIAGADYLDYVADLSREKWRADHVADGADEIARRLAVKNTIPNVSGTLFRRQPLAAVMTEHFDRIGRLKVAGDWLTYVLCLERGRVAFSARALNLHRRHAGGIAVSTAASDGSADHLREILAVQRFVAERHPVPDDVRRKARRYAQEVFARFGLDRGSGPTLDELAASAPVLSGEAEPAPDAAETAPDAAETAPDAAETAPDTAEAGHDVKPSAREVKKTAGGVADTVR